MDALFTQLNRTPNGYEPDSEGALYTADEVAIKGVTPSGRTYDGTAWFILATGPLGELRVAQRTPGAIAAAQAALAAQPVLPTVLGNTGLDREVWRARILQMHAEGRA